MFCPKCGYNLKDGAKFCPKCGAKIIPSGGAKETVSSVQKPEPPKENQGSQPRKHMIPVAIAIGMVVVAVAALAGVLIYSRISEPPETVSLMAETVSQDSGWAEESFSSGESSTSTTAPATTAAPVLTEAMPETAAVAVPNLSETTQAATISVTPDSVTSRLLEEMPDLSDYQRVGVTRAGSTSTIVQKGNKNGPEMVLDGNEVTSWQEGVDGPGIGQIIYYELNEEQPISYLSFKLGNWRNDKYFYSNNRPRTLTITLNDYTCQITFPAEKKEYFVEINPPYPSNYIEFRIDEVYQGSQYDDTCIAEIGMYCKTGD